jgi:hypothetical protein
MTHRPLALLVALATALPAAASTGREPPPRVAIVVGAQGGAPGRAGLRHAHRDAQTIAEVLATVGRFPRERVHVLRDPSPERLLATLQREASALAGRPDALLFFYFSGHADRGALFSGGSPVPLDAVRRTLDRQDVAMRIGVIDACQGGGWTRAKGLVSEEPFEVTLPQVLESEGSALISSSTGEESAHESDALGGSFFTVHLAAGLRGAADESGDGDVTLTEAFEYARQQTIRDTARAAREPQHPSFALNLRGRQDVVLAQIAASPSTLAVEQTRGPLELVHLASGLRMLELPPGRRSARIAVPPGRYMVRRVAQDGVHARELDVPRQGQVDVDEGELVLVASQRLAVKGGARSPAATPARGDWELSLGMMATTASDKAGSIQVGDVSQENPGLSLRVDGRVAVTDRLTLRLGALALAWRISGDHGTEIVPYGGLLGWSFDYRGRIRVGAGAALRQSLGAHSLLATVGYDTDGVVEGGAVTVYSQERYHASLGYGLAIGRAAFVHVGAMVERLLPDPDYISDWAPQTALYVGSVQELGLATLPLVRIALPAAWFLDLHGAVTAKVWRDAVLGEEWKTASPGVQAGFGLLRRF